MTTSRFDDKQRGNPRVVFGQGSALPSANDQMAFCSFFLFSLCNSLASQARVDSRDSASCFDSQNSRSTSNDRVLFFCFVVLSSTSPASSIPDSPNFLTLLFIDFCDLVFYGPPGVQCQSFIRGSWRWIPATQVGHGSAATNFAIDRWLYPDSKRAAFSSHVPFYHRVA